MTRAEDQRLSELPWSEPPAPRAEVSSAIRAKCTGDLRPARRMSAALRGLLTVALSGSVVGLLLYLGFRLSPNRPEGMVRTALLGALVWGVVHAAVLTVGLVRPPGRRGARSLRLGMVVVLPLAFFGYLALASSDTLPFARFAHEGRQHAVLCGVHALLFGAIASGGTLLLWRRTDPLAPGLSGALAGLCGGLVGAAGIGVACPSDEAWHLWFAHGSVVVVFVLLGWVIGRRWLAP